MATASHRLPALFYGLAPTSPSPSSTTHPFLLPPLISPLLFHNASSDARDHLANERTFLSWLKLSVYMSIVSVAITVSFHIKNEPSEIEERIRLPLGLIFWVLSFACLANGLATYVKTVTYYGRRRALVQSGWKTQVVFTVVASAIIAACVLFLSVNASTK
ncbi:MAG: hypothetical protein Q9181_001013 [Wetmoreana brouardii]